MSEAAQLAKSAREQLANALSALQSNAHVPEELLQAAEPIAEAMSVLHRVERTNGQNLEGRDLALENVRTALQQIQKVNVHHPAIEVVMEAVATSLSKVHALARYTPPLEPPAAAARAPADIPPPPGYVPMPPAQPITPSRVSGGTLPIQPNPFAAPPSPAAPRPTPPPAQPLPQAAPQPVMQPQQPYYAQQNAAGTLPLPQGASAPMPQQAQQAPQPWGPPPAPAYAQPPMQQQPMQQQPMQQARPTPAPQQPAPQVQRPSAPMAAPAPAQRPSAPMPAAPAPSAAAPSGRIDVELGTHSPSNFYKGLSGNDVIEHGGIFIATYKKIPRIGTTVTLRVLLPGDYEFPASGVVQWTREGGGESADPGFGVRLTQISPEGRQLVYRYTRNREPMFYDDL